ncbi:hypothetical protein DAEQUDRAFT_82344 [Daedalea quercina L-15889]|uniref:DUF6534 domain-containing protein n=1 Tax=Daedalea quercina L-15889 TaxID=1314783 RepID=A0A165SHM5_9APHY|nr:hypothetical protein DAEQUDRAFT_82344 [Daedalea quercina L-15889]
MSSSAQAQAQSARFKSNVTSLYFSVNIQALTFGLASLVTVAYFRLPRKADARWIRILIMVVWGLCAFCTAIDFYSLHYFLVQTLSIPETRIRAPWSLSLLIAVVASVSTLVRLLLLNRLARFHHHKGDLSHWLIFPIALVALLSLVGIAGGIGITVRLLLPVNSAVERLKRLFDALLACSISADVLFVVVQSYSLHMSRSGLRRTNSVINLLILYTMSTGLIPAALALATLISMLAAPQSLFYAILYMQVGNLYLITLVTSLNYRDTVYKRMTRPLELNYSIFENSHTESVTESSAPETTTVIPEPQYADASKAGSFRLLQANDPTEQNSSSEARVVLAKRLSGGESDTALGPADTALAQHLAEGRLT